MTNLPETDGMTFPEVRQIENGETQAGGPDGLWNEHARAMIERTNHLMETTVKNTGDQDIDGAGHFARLSAGGLIVPADETFARAQVNGFMRSGNLYLHSHLGDNALAEVQQTPASYLMRRISDGKLAYDVSDGIVWTDKEAARRRGGSGYEKFPSGLIIQWTTIIIAISATSVSGSFPITFPTGCLHAWAHRETVSAPTANDMLTVWADTPSAFTLRSLTSPQARQFTVFAIGH